MVWDDELLLRRLISFPFLQVYQFICGLFACGNCATRLGCPHRGWGCGKYSFVKDCFVPMCFLITKALFRVALACAEHVSPKVLACKRQDEVLNIAGRLGMNCVECHAIMK